MSCNYCKEVWIIATLTHDAMFRCLYESSHLILSARPWWITFRGLISLLEIKNVENPMYGHVRNTYAVCVHVVWDM